MVRWCYWAWYFCLLLLCGTGFCFCFCLCFLFFFVLVFLVTCLFICAALVVVLLFFSLLVEVWSASMTGLAQGGAQKGPHTLPPKGLGPREGQEMKRGAPPGNPRIRWGVSVGQPNYPLSMQVHALIRVRPVMLG